MTGLHDSERAGTPPADRWFRRWVLVAILGLLLGGYPALVLLADSRTAIEAYNGLLLALAAGVATAYAPVAVAALREPRVSRADILALGIFLSWAAVAIARSVSIVWRGLGAPPAWLDSAWWGAHIAVSAVAAMCHLLAPEAVAGRVPRREWVRIGGIVAIGVLLALIVTLVGD